MKNLDQGSPRCSRVVAQTTCRSEIGVMDPAPCFLVGPQRISGAREGMRDCSALKGGPSRDPIFASYWRRRTRLRCWRATLRAAAAGVAGEIITAGATAPEQRRANPAMQPHSAQQWKPRKRPQRDDHRVPTPKGIAAGEIARGGRASPDPNTSLPWLRQRNPRNKRVDDPERRFASSA